MGRGKETTQGLPWIAAGVILTLGVLLRASFVHHAGRLEGDPILYGNLAENLLRHHGYSFAAAPGPYPPTLIRLPGYPLFLAACFALFGIGKFGAVVVVQIVVDLFSCVLLASMAFRLFGRRAATACLLLGAACPFTANYTAIPLTETLTLAAIVAAFAALERWQTRPRLSNGWLWALGAALAAALLLRPEQGLLSVAILPAMAIMGFTSSERSAAGLQATRNWLVPPLAVVLCVALPLVPWAARNWHTFHLVQPLAPRSATDPGELVPRGFQHWFRSWAIEFASTEEVYWNYDGTAIRIEDLPTRAFDSPEQRAETAELLRDYNETTNPTAAFDLRFQRIAQERIRGHMARYYLWLPAARLVNMLLRPRTELMNTQLAWWAWRENLGQAVFALVYALLNLIYLILGVLGWFRWKRFADREQKIVIWTIFAFVLLRCALLLTLDNSEPRYTLEFFPLGILCASALARDASRRSPTSPSSSSRP